MLTTYLKMPRTLEHYRSGLAGPHLDAFLSWLEERGYQPRRIPHLLRGAHRFSRWAQGAVLRIEQLDTSALEAYGHHLQGLQRLRYPSGRLSHLFVGARSLVTFLENVGLVAPVALASPLPPEPELLGAFRHWMRAHRGTTEATLNGYRLTVIDLLRACGEQPEYFEAKALRAFVLECAGRGGIGRAKTVVTAVRMFLRFLIAIGRCPGAPPRQRRQPHPWRACATAFCRNPYAAARGLTSIHWGRSAPCVGGDDGPLRQG